MRSRQYLVYLVRLDRMLAWRVYADRSVEWGHIEQGDFVSKAGRIPQFESNLRAARDSVAQNLLMARLFRYKILREYL